MLMKPAESRFENDNHYISETDFLYIIIQLRKRYYGKQLSPQTFTIAEFYPANIIKSTFQINTPVTDLQFVNLHIHQHSDFKK